MKGCRKLIFYDIRIGVLQQYFLWLAIPIFLFAGLLFESMAVTPCRIDLSSIEVKLGDALLYSFVGKELVDFMQRTTDFTIPMLWIALILGSSMSTVGYGECFTNYGQQVFLRSQKKYLWWVSKCVWNVISTMIYFIIGFLTLGLVAIIKGWKIDLSNTAELVPYIFKERVEVMKIPVLQLVLLVIAMCVAWNLFQMFLALFVGTFMSIICTILMLLLSVCIYSSFLPGNYMMLMRNAYLMYGGLPSSRGYLACLLLMILSVVGGCWKIKNRDYFIERD